MKRLNAFNSGEKLKFGKKNDYLIPSIWDRIKNKNKYFIWVNCDNCGMDNRAAVPKGTRIEPGVTITCDNCGVEVEVEEYKTEWIK